MQAVTIYTDGACRGNPGPGGWGALLISPKKQREIYGGDNPTTNNRMELQAVIEALELLKVPCRISLHTDSRYVMDGITKWIVNWKKKNWVNSKKEPVKNTDLWKLLDQATKRHEINWIWVRGHNGDEGNERADQLANLGIDQLLANGSKRNF
ncbi:ribonuclease HI [Acidithrix sp. C25]|uniref:ribonuclease HI n=1 Tax=Acidithrix TaxID=1609233 RepID=UPI000695AD86